MDGEIREEMVEVLPLERVLRVPQPRRRFDPGKLAELVEAIRQLGQTTPALGRKREDGTVELVNGERRWIALEKLGRPIRIVVRDDMTDAEAHAIRVVENAKRTDLTPIERAEAAGEAMRVYGYSIESWAIRTGSTLAQVKRDLALLELPKEIRRWYDEERIDDAALVAIAQAPVSVARAISKHERIARALEAGDRITKTLVASLLADYTYDLLRAPFPTGDADLVPAAGACGECPHRSEDTQLGFLAEVLRPAHCARPPCFEQKADAHAERVLEGAKQRRLLVLKGARAEAAFEPGGEYVRLDEVAYRLDRKGKAWPAEDVYEYDGKGKPIERRPVTVREALGNPDPVVAKDPRARAVVELGLRAALETALAKVLPQETVGVSGHERTKADREKAKRERALALAKREGLDAAARAVRDAFVGDTEHEHDAQILANLVHAEIRRAKPDVLADLCRLWPWSLEDQATGAKDEPKDGAAKLLSTLKGREVGAMLTVLSILRDRGDYEDGLAYTAFETVTGEYGVDVEHYVREAERKARGVETKRGKAKKRAKAEASADAVAEEE